MSGMGSVSPMHLVEVGGGAPRSKLPLVTIASARPDNRHRRIREFFGRQDLHGIKLNDLVSMKASFRAFSPCHYP